MASTLKKKQSDDNLNVTSGTDNEKIFSYHIIFPIFIASVFSLSLYNFVEKMRKEVSAPNLYRDQFKEVWWSIPSIFSVLYLCMVFIGPTVMETRSEVKIKPYIFVYNLYQCVFNLLTVIGMIYEIYSNPWFKAPWGNTVQELLDTLWMILRKKKEQLSFLHCYHHLLMMWAWFFCIRCETGGDVYFGACVNSFIHVIMYGYYTMALLGIPCPWKKWITNCQMIQFVAVLSHSVFVVVYGNMPIELPLNQGFVMINMLILFSQFYSKQYGKKTHNKIE